MISDFSKFINPVLTKAKSEHLNCERYYSFKCEQI